MLCTLKSYKDNKRIKEKKKEINAWKSERCHNLTLNDLTLIN